MMDDAPFHAGEVALQARHGLARRLDEVGRNIVRDHMPDQHRELFEKLPTFFVGTLDAAGQPWASVLAGPPGFVHTPDARTLRIAARPAAGDPAAVAIEAGAPVGLLGLEPHTRRRNRANGRVLAADAAGFSVGVTQSFGNCPKYIQAREPHWCEAPPRPAQAIGARLDGPAAALVAQSDTLFIASASGRTVGTGRAEGVDVSHRGGLPGFVEQHDDGEHTTLLIPDYAGNFLFNTFGNLLQWPRAGLLFIDADSGDLLQLAVTTELVLDGPELARHAGAQRLLRCRVEHGWWRPAALPLRWSEPVFAPQFAGRSPKLSGRPERA